MPLEPPTCCDCGGPRSASSGQRCRRCYKLIARAHKLGKEALAVAQEFQTAAYLHRDIGDLVERDIRVIADLLKATGEDLLKA